MNLCSTQQYSALQLNSYVSDIFFFNNMLQKWLRQRERSHAHERARGDIPSPASSRRARRACAVGNAGAHGGRAAAGAGAAAAHVVRRERHALHRRVQSGRRRQRACEQAIPEYPDAAADDEAIDAAILAIAVASVAELSELTASCIYGGGCGGDDGVSAAALLYGRRNRARRLRAVRCRATPEVSVIH